MLDLYKLFDRYNNVIHFPGNITTLMEYPTWATSHVSFPFVRLRPTLQTLSPCSGILVHHHQGFYRSVTGYAKLKKFKKNYFNYQNNTAQHVAGLDIGLWQPLARGASESENPLAPQKTHWPPQKHVMTQMFSRREFMISRVKLHTFVH